MEYITVRDAAQKWNISERLVQKYCAMGRIEGAKKFGSSWGIPAGAVKPKDPRKAQKAPAMRRERRQPVSYPGLMPLMNTAFEPGKCLEFIHDMADGPQKRIALAEYYYFSGQPEKAAHETELFLTGADRDIQLSACLIYAYANLSVGKIQQARYALTAVREMLAAATEKQPEMRAALSFISLAAAVLLHLAFAGGIAAHAGIPSHASDGNQNVCIICKRTLYLSAKGLPKESRHRGGDPWHADGRIPNPLYLSAFGCGYGLYEFKTNRQSKAASACGMGRLPDRMI